MKTLKMTLISLPVLTLLLVLGAADDAQARIRVKASVRTPHVVVRIDNGAYRPTYERRRALPVRYHREFEVTKRDRRIARRLAWYTGAPKRDLIQLKRQGYTWSEIGQWLGISRKAVRAAQSGHKWERFLKRNRQGGYCEVGGYHDD